MLQTDLGQIIYSLSKALDLSSDGIRNHHQTVAVISFALGENLLLHKEDLDLLFLSSLVHDAGIISKCETEGLLAFEDKKPEEHCKKGYDIFSKSKYTRDIATILFHHHDRWQGGNASGFTEDNTPLISNIIYLADRVATLIDTVKGCYPLYDHKEITEKVIGYSGTLFNPKVVKAFIEVSRKEAFWLDLQCEIIDDIINAKKPIIKLNISDEEIIEIADAFSKIIDNKSPYTHHHSQRVADVAEFIADKLYFSEHEKSIIKVAGLLHDLGKIAIPNDLLDKPSKLTEEEFALIKKHSYFSYHLLKNIPGFEQVSLWGALHHEKINGTGYPFKLEGNQIPIGSKIMAVSDMFVALTEDRPYRKQLSKQECLIILKAAAQRKDIDDELVKIVEIYQDELLKLTNFKRNLKII